MLLLDKKILLPLLTGDKKYVKIAVIISTHRAPVAQWIEHSPPKRGVMSSSLVGGATENPVTAMVTGLLAAAQFCANIRVC